MKHLNDMDDAKLSKIKKKLLNLKKKNELKKEGIIDYSKVFNSILIKLEQIEKKEINIDLNELSDGLKEIASLLVSIRPKEIKFPGYLKDKIEEVVVSVKKLQNSIEKKEKEKMLFWNKMIVLFKKPIDFKEIGNHLKELAGRILKVRIEEQAIVLRVKPVDEKGNLLRPISNVVVQGLGILKNIIGDQINPATEEKQDDIITAIGTISGGGVTSVGDGTKIVTTAGVPVQLPNQECKRVFIQCAEWNGDVANCPLGGIIVVGGSTVVAALATRRGLALFPTQGDWFNVSNLNLLYIDSLDDGAKINYYWEK